MTEPRAHRIISDWSVTGERREFCICGCPEAARSRSPDRICPDWPYGPCPPEREATPSRDPDLYVDETA